MLHTLVLMRHAKSSWKDPSLVDHERPLNARGERAAKLIAQVLVARGSAPDQIWASDSVRTTQTAKWLIRGIPGPQIIRYFPEFYHASADDVFEVCSKQEAPAGALMLLGHNPGWASLFEIYTGKMTSFPTAACCVLGRRAGGAPNTPWYDPQNWRLKDFIKPKDFEPITDEEDQKTDTVPPPSGEGA